MSHMNLTIIDNGLMDTNLTLTLQNTTHQHDWRITLIEPFAPNNKYQPNYDARSTALSYGSRLIYEHLGLWQTIAQHAEPIQQIHVSDRGRFGATRLQAIKENVPTLGYVMENA